MKKKQSNYLQFAAFLALLIFTAWGGYSIALMTNNTPPSQPAVPVEADQQPSPSAISTVTFDALETNAVTEPASPPPSLPLKDDEGIAELTRNMMFFESTLKSCLGRYCIDIAFPTGKGGAKQDRYGLLRPSETFHAKALFKSAKLIESDSQSFLESTHVPTYGYGKNHGWTRIVRLVDDVALQAYRDIEPFFSESQKAPVKMEDAYAAQLRALLRWHCRLNHVAAHTSMLTVKSDHLFSNPHFEAQSIASFFNMKDPKPFFDDFLRSDTLQTLAQRRSYDQLPTPYRHVAASVIADEMLRSRNMTKWPCLPFKELRTQLVTQEHRQWAPNCSRDSAASGSAAYPKCSVQYDFAEQ